MSELFTVIENAEEFEEVTTGRQYPIPEQHGPLCLHDETKRCASKGCSSPTIYTVMGIPRCYVHALREMNEMLYNFGVERPNRAK
jgi:hypothetical protein